MAKTSFNVTQEKYTLALIKYLIKKRYILEAKLHASKLGYALCSSSNL